MKALLVAAMLIGGAIPFHLTAQRGGGGGGGAHGGGAAHPGFGFGFGSGTGRGGRFGNSRFFGGGLFGNGFGRGRNNGNGWGSGWGSGWDYGSGWDDSPYFAEPGSPPAYGDGNQNHPGAMLLVPPLSPAPPPQPAHPVIREYNWQADASDTHATFSIAPKNGEVRHAVAVWVQDNEVRFTDTDGRAGRMPPAAVDCGATDRINAQKNLKLSLPGCGLSR
jgi:hypothetical protein